MPKPQAQGVKLLLNNRTRKIMKQLKELNLDNLPVWLVFPILGNDQVDSVLMVGDNLFGISVYGTEVATVSLSQKQEG